MNYLARLKRLLKQSNRNVVCFDYFDTIVSRDVSPEEIKRSWAKHCSKYFFNGLTPEILYVIRKKIEKQLYNNINNNYEFTYYMLMEKIYKYISGFHSIDAKKHCFSDFYKYSIKCEVTVEIESQFVNKDIIKLIDYCYNQNIEMLIISDFYLGKDLFKSFLGHHNLSEYFSNIFISCDYLKSKRIGDLYECVKEKYNNVQLIMIGDNEYADITNSKKSGFRSLFVKRDKTFKYYQLYEDVPKSITFSKLELIRNAKSSYLSNYAFTLYILIDRLYSEALTSGIENLYFFARDGEFIKYLFDIYQSKKTRNKQIKTHYLLLSRNSTYLPACKSIDEEDFDGIFSHYDYVRLEDFLVSLSFSKKQIDDVFKSVNCERDYCFSKDNFDFIDKIKHDETFRNYYERNRIKSKELFYNYLHQEIEQIDDFAIVDIGWRGTIQDNIYFVLNRQPTIKGYYYGIQENHNIFGNNQKNGLIFSIDNQSNTSFDIYYFEYWFIEIILTGSHGKVVSYKRIGKEVDAIFQDDSDGLLFEKYIKTLREEICKKFIAIDNTIMKSRFDVDVFLNFFESVHYMTSRFFPVFFKKDNYILRELHSQGFGLVSSNNKISGKGYYTYFENEYGLSYLKKVLIEYRTFVNKYQIKDYLIINQLYLNVVKETISFCFLRIKEIMKNIIKNNPKKRIGNYLRCFYRYRQKKKNKNNSISVIASNCNGALILHDLGVRFNSPFVNLWIKPKDYIKLLKDFDRYMAADLSEIFEDGISYPIGKLDDISIYFQHYDSFEQAKEKWDERKKRIDKTNLFVLFTDRDGCTYEDLVEFDSLPYNKVVFTNKPYPEIKSSFYIKGFENLESVGHCYEYMPGRIIKYYDQFDYVKWFNEGAVKRKRYGLFN